MGLLAVPGVVAGCNSTHYTSPRITGRVLDRQSHQPLENARVQRQAGPAYAGQGPGEKGSAHLQQTPWVLTDANGAFVLKSESTLAFVRDFGWYSVTVRFERSGYEPLQQSYTLGNSTNLPSGEPLVQTGDVLLTPLTK